MDVNNIVDSLYRLLGFYKDHSSGMDSKRFERAVDEAIKAVKAESKWIPVTERLPKSSGVYIVTREFNDGFECADLTDACYFDGTNTWHNDNRINHGREYVGKKIKAWMPLPEPFKAEIKEVESNE